MYKLILQFIFIICLTGTLQSQDKEIVVKINHHLGNEVYESGLSSHNNMDHKFMLSRLEYYISEISVMHDGGQETLVKDLWVLANANDKTTVIELGSLEVETIEGLSFHIGVDPDHNHLDPTIWPSSHPLAPKAPSMHWGWAAGYRFVALEGYGGDNLNRKIEIHGLGDINYSKTTIRKSSVYEDGKDVLYVDANYTKALENISVQNGLIVHAENFQAQSCLTNFNSQVFTAGQTTTSTEDHFNSSDIIVYPNPSAGMFKIDLGKMESHIRTIKLVDMEGRLIEQIDEEYLSDEINIRFSGNYIIMLEGDNGLVGIKHVSVF